MIHERDSLDRELKSTIESHLNQTDNLKAVLKSQSSDLNMLKVHILVYLIYYTSYGVKGIGEIQHFFQ